MSGMGFVRGIALALARLLAALLPRRRRSTEEQARLSRAVAAIDRELAGNLELVTMFMQTKQPVVLENAAYQVHRREIAADDETLAARLDRLYEAMPHAESAMERRGPAGSIPRAERDTVERWEGDARTVQREVRAAPGRRPRSAGDRLVEWVRARVERSAAA
jgi:hypothetical protein